MKEISVEQKEGLAVLDKIKSTKTGKLLTIKKNLIDCRLLRARRALSCIQN